jgi:endonuclease YncB( thermonuclease family)
MFYKAKVTRVIDGDTFEAAIEMWPEITILTRVRVFGVNTPELKSKDVEESKRAFIARRFTADQILSMPVELAVHGKDSFGRVLCDVKYDGKDLSEELIKNGHATKYRAT